MKTVVVESNSKAPAEKLGFAVTAIKIPDEIRLFGYPEINRPCKKTNPLGENRLQCSSLFFEWGNANRFIWIFLECCLLLPEDAEAIKRIVNNRTGIEKKAIWISCSHTHSAPLPRFSEAKSKVFELLKPFGDLNEQKLFEYGEEVIQAILESSRSAIKRTSPWYVTGRQEPSQDGYNRRVISEGKLSHCWNPAKQTNLSPETAKGVYNTCLQFVKTDNPSETFLLHSTGIHPVVLGSRSSILSGDWPQTFRENVNSREQSIVAFTLDASAEVHPWHATQEDAEKLKAVAEPLTSILHPLEKTNEAETIEPSLIATATKELLLPVGEISIGILRLGPWIIVSLPLELSARLAEEIRNEIKQPVIFATNTNGWNGYWMHPDDYAFGGYEIELAKALHIGITEILNLKETICRMIQKK